MIYRDETQTDLYLVRIWRRKSRDGALGVRGKLQHIQSGESSYFETLSDLPQALQKMIDQQVGSYSRELISPASVAPEDEPEAN